MRFWNRINDQTCLLIHYHKYRVEIFEIRKGYHYSRDFPANFKSEDSFRFDPIRDCAVSRAFIERIDSCKICQYYIFSKRKMLEDFCLPIQLRGKQNIVKQWIKLQLFPKIRVEEAIWVIDLWSKNYFHWVLECLPRILNLRRLGILAPLLIPEHLYEISYIHDSLVDLNIETITFNFRQTVLVKKLMVVSHDSPCAFDRDYLKLLVDTFQTIDQAEPKPATRKIYISRKDAGKRMVANEEELVPYLLDAGFEFIQMEMLNFKEQRELMRETSVLLSIHGAGLSNLIFMQKGSKVIELHPDTASYNSCFYHLSAALGIDYYYSFEKGDHGSPQEANITVEVERFSKTLDQF